MVDDDSYGGRIASRTCSRWSSARAPGAWPGGAKRGEDEVDEPEVCTGDQGEQHLAFSSIMLQEEVGCFSARAMIDDMQAALSREAMAARLRERGYGGVG